MYSSRVGIGYSFGSTGSTKHRTQPGGVRVAPRALPLGPRRSSTVDSQERRGRVIGHRGRAEDSRRHGKVCVWRAIHEIDTIWPKTRCKKPNWSLRQRIGIDAGESPRAVPYAPRSAGMRMRRGGTLKDPEPPSLTAEALRPRTLRVLGRVARVGLNELRLVWLDRSESREILPASSVSPGPSSRPSCGPSSPKMTSPRA